MGRKNCKFYKFGNIIAPQGRIPCTILTLFSGFFRFNLMARFPKIFRGLSDILFIGSEKVREVLNDTELHHQASMMGLGLHMLPRGQKLRRKPQNSKLGCVLLRRFCNKAVLLMISSLKIFFLLVCLSVSRVSRV